MRIEKLKIFSNDINDFFYIDVRVPSSQNAPFDVVYVLDSNIYFDLAISSAKLMEFGKEIKNAIYVGIGYVTDRVHFDKRNRDLTPTYHSTHKNSGGGKLFQNFLNNELIPMIEKDYPCSGKRYLLGDSYSGLYGLFELFTQDNFDGYIIGSPAIYWDDTIIINFYNQAKFKNKRNIFISAGELEEKTEPLFARMVQNVEMMSEHLKRNNMDVTTFIFENETHLSVIPATISRGLRVMLGKEK